MACVMDSWSRLLLCTCNGIATWCKVGKESGRLTNKTDARVDLCFSRRTLTSSPFTLQSSACALKTLTDAICSATSDHYRTCRFRSAFDGPELLVNVGHTLKVSSFMLPQGPAEPAQRTRAVAGLGAGARGPGCEVQASTSCLP